MLNLWSNNSDRLERCLDKKLSKISMSLKSRSF